MFFRPQARRGVVGFQELFGFVETHVQKFANLALGKFTGTVSFQRNLLQRAPWPFCTVKVHLAGERIWKFNRENHASIVSKLEG